MKVERWKEHLVQLLNRPDLPQLANVPESEEVLDINLGPITGTEVKEVIQLQKVLELPVLMGSVLKC